MTTHLSPEPNPTMDALALPPQEPVSAGQLLKTARQQAGVELSVLSQILKVPVKQLEALESDDIDPAKGIAFFRGLAAAVCRHLQTDASPVLALMPSSPVIFSPQKTVGQTPGPVMHFGTLRSSPSRQKRSVGVWALGMLFVIAALLWLPAPSQWLWLDDVQDWLASISLNESNPDRKDPEGAPQPDKDRPLSEQQGASESVAMPLPISQIPDASAATATATATATAATALASAASPASTAVAPTLPPASASAPSVSKDNPPAKLGKSASVDWVFSASADSWIELRSGPSVVVWSGLVKAGQSQQVQSPLPVSLVIGRAQGVSVTLRGQPFDLKPHTQVTVARFEVKE